MKKLNKTALAIALVMLAASCQNSAPSTEEALVLDSTSQKTEASISSSKKEIIVDVRTVDEWNNDGHAACSINIPLDELEHRMGELKEYGTVKLVCRSGNRAETARELLSGSGFAKVENLGSWQNVDCK